MKKTTVSGTCRLCLQQSELINSHILPRWFFKWLKKGVKTSGQYITVSGEVAKVGLGQDELTEHLLCAPCDNSFSNIEQVFRWRFQAWFNHPFPHRYFHVPLPRPVEIPYVKAKLFAWLLVWRMAVSSRQEFAEVKLPPEVTEDLRLRLQSGDVGPWHQYPVYIELESLGKFKLMFATPRMTRSDEMGCYILRWFVAGGWLNLVFPIEGTGVIERWNNYARHQLKDLPGFIKEDGRISFLVKPIGSDDSLTRLFSEDVIKQQNRVLSRLGP